MSLSGPTAVAFFVSVAAGLPVLDIAALRLLGGRGRERDRGRALGPAPLGVRAGQLGDLMVLLPFDLLAVGVIAFAAAGSGYDRALALAVLAFVAALAVLVALHRRRRATPFAG